MFSHRTLLVLCVCISAIAAQLRAESPTEADILLEGGTIVDGSGGKPRAGNVAVRNGEIVAVGDTEGIQARQTIDCKGLIVCPGFIDLHNHSDSTILDPKTRDARCYLTQGCTTLVTGNCGGGVREIDKYYDDLAASGVGINIAHLVPHGSIRDQVMGKVRRAPTDEELKQMQALIDAGMRDGAWGISTGLQYVPGSFAETDELIAVASTVARHGGIYASHIRDEGDTLIESIQEVIDISRGANLPCHVSHLKASKKPNWGKVRAAAHVIEQARRDGLRITADQYPYTASSTSIMAMLLPDEEREGGEKATVERLKDAEQMKRLRPIIAAAVDARGEVMVASASDRPEWIGKTIAEIAAKEKRDQLEVAIELLRDHPDAQGVNFGMDEADVRYIMALPWVATASDGSSKIDDGTRPHPRSYGTFPRKIGRYALQEKVLPLSDAVRSATGLPAEIIGITDRGLVRENLAADLVVFDPEQFEDRATYEKPFEKSVGLRWLLVNGKVAIADGEPQNVLAGRPLRRQTPKSNAAAQ